MTRDRLVTVLVQRLALRSLGWRPRLSWPPSSLHEAGRQCSKARRRNAAWGPFLALDSGWTDASRAMGGGIYGSGVCRQRTSSSSASRSTALGGMVRSAGRDQSLAPQQAFGG